MTPASRAARVDAHARLDNYTDREPSAVVDEIDRHRILTISVSDDPDADRRAPLIGEIGLDHRFVTDPAAHRAEVEVVATLLDYAAEHVHANLRRLVRHDPHLAPWRPLLAATGACPPDESSST